MRKGSKFIRSTDNDACALSYPNPHTNRNASAPIGDDKVTSILLNSISIRGTCLNITINAKIFLLQPCCSNKRNCLQIIVKPSNNFN